MTEEEIMQSVREARQRVMDELAGKSPDEVMQIINEAGRRMIEKSEQRRRAAAQNAPTED